MRNQAVHLYVLMNIIYLLTIIVGKKLLSIVKKKCQHFFLSRNAGAYAAFMKGEFGLLGCTKGRTQSARVFLNSLLITYY